MGGENGFKGLWVVRLGVYNLYYLSVFLYLVNINLNKDLVKYIDELICSRLSNLSVVTTHLLFSVVTTHLL